MFQIEWTKSDKEAKYISLFQNIAFANLHPEKAKKEFPKGISYDYDLLLLLVNVMERDEGGRWAGSKT